MAELRQTYVLFHVSVLRTTSSFKGYSISAPRKLGFIQHVQMPSFLSTMKISHFPQRTCFVFTRVRIWAQ
jgi:hypothetical protein